MYFDARWFSEVNAALAKDNHVLFLPPTIAISEADEVSHDDIRDAIRDALIAITPDRDGFYSWVVEVFEDYVVYTEETPTGHKMYRRPYTIDTEGEALLGNATEVEKVVEYIPVGTAPVAESGSVEVIGQVLDLVEVSVRPDNTIPIKIMQPGWGRSAHYPADVLKRDGPGVFTKGTHMHWDHPTEAEEADRPEGSLDGLAGVLAADARWEDEGPTGPGLYGDAEVFGAHRESMDELAPHIGVSIKTSGLGEMGEAEGRQGPILTELLKHKFTAIDFVTKAGAGGEVLQLFEAARHNTAGRSEPMTDELKTAQTELVEAKATIEELTPKVELAEADRNELTELRKGKIRVAAREATEEELKDTDLPDAAKEKIVDAIAEDPPVTEDGELDTTAAKARAAKDAQNEADYLVQVAKEPEEVEEAAGASGLTPSQMKFAESAKRAHPDFTEAQINTMVTGRR